MIIKIEGLPEGQKIEHINVDITFAADGSPVVKTQTEPKVTTNQDNSGDGISLEPIPAPETFEFDGRPLKEIPPEMQDLEF